MEFTLADTNQYYNWQRDKIQQAQQAHDLKQVVEWGDKEGGCSHDNIFPRDCPKCWAELRKLAGLEKEAKQK